MKGATGDSPAELEVRAVRPGDEGGISELLCRAFGLGRSAAFWSWWLHGNRAGPSQARLGIDETGKVIGMGGASPRRMNLAGDEVPALLSGDLFIDPGHRSRALFGRLAVDFTRDPTTRAAGFLFGFPNAQGTRAASLIGYRTVAEVQYRFLVLDTTPYISRAIGFRPLARLVAGGINALLRLIRIGRPAAPPGIRVETIETFDPRFDRLWEEEKSDWPITTVRRADYLNWRYIESPVDYRVIAAETVDGGDLLGYMVLTISEARGRRMGAVVDWFCRRSSPGAFDGLLREAADWCAHRGCHVLRAWDLDGGWSFRPFERHRMIRRPSGFHLVVRPGTVTDAGRLLDPSNWHVTQGDSDHIDGDA
jgi:hypothetical protein